MSLNLPNLFFGQKDQKKEKYKIPTPAFLYNETMAAVSLSSSLVLAFNDIADDFGKILKTFARAASDCVSLTTIIIQRRWSLPISCILGASFESESFSVSLQVFKSNQFRGHPKKSLFGGNTDLKSSKQKWQFPSTSSVTYKYLGHSPFASSCT